MHLITLRGLHETPAGAQDVPPEMRAEFVTVIDGLPADAAAAADQAAMFAERRWSTRRSGTCTGS